MSNMYFNPEYTYLKQKFNFFKKPSEIKEKGIAISCLERFTGFSQMFLINPLLVLALFILLNSSYVTSINQYISINAVMLEDFGITILGIAIQAEIAFLSLRILFLPKIKVKPTIIKSCFLMLTSIFTYFFFVWCWTEILNFLSSKLH